MVLLSSSSRKVTVSSPSVTWRRVSQHDLAAAVIMALLASLVLVLLPELGRDFAEYRMLLFGAAMVLIMVWKPGGILSHREPTLRYTADGEGK